MSRIPLPRCTGPISGIALGVLLAPALHAQSFQSNYGAGKYEEGVAVLVDGDAITSVVRHHRAGYGHGLQLLRTTLGGMNPVILDIPLPGAAFPQSAVRAPDGDIVIGGSIIPEGRYDQDALLVKVTPSGVVVWVWTSDNGGGEEEFLCVDALDDGYAAGGVWRHGADSDALLARFTGGGSVLWQEHYGTPRDERVTGIAHDGNGLVAVGGNYSTAGDLDAFVLRTDGQGSEQWQRTWGGLEDDAASDIIARMDGSFVWSGYTDSFPIGDTTVAGERFRHVYTMAIGAAGDSLWSAEYGDTLRDRQAWTLLPAPNNELLIAGENTLGHRSNAFTIRASSTGTLIWERTYALQRTDRLRDLTLMPDGGFVGTGKCVGTQGGQVLVMRKNGSGE